MNRGWKRRGIDEGAWDGILTTDCADEHGWGRDKVTGYTGEMEKRICWNTRGFVEVAQRDVRFCRGFCEGARERRKMKDKRRKEGCGETL